MKKIIIFASGTGTNTENLISFFNTSNVAKVALVVSNNAAAKVLEKSKLLNVKTLTFDKKDFYESNNVLNCLLSENPDLIVLSGFLLLMPANIVSAFPQRIINIHPALLPKYGGKGMYGENVHKAVIYNKEQESGITIHYINDKYDEGDIIFQKKCPVFEHDTVATLAKRVHLLEYEYFPKVVQDILVN